jgi:hypothetical protein
MTGRRPVQVSEDLWPVLASASGDNCSIIDPALHDQAIVQGQADTFWLFVRQHDDGRAIVYGGYNEGEFIESDHDGLDRAGEAIVDVDGLGEIVTVIERVGETLGVPAQLIADCIADLPAEEM